MNLCGAIQPGDDVIPIGRAKVSILWVGQLTLLLDVVQARHKLLSVIGSQVRLELCVGSSIT